MADGNAHAVRSWLFTPGTRPERFAKASEVGADVLIIDLEDSVAPADKKQARKNAFARLTDKTQEKIQLALRINSLVTRAGLDDMTDLLDSSVDPVFLVLPKVEAAADLVNLDRLLTASGKQCSLVALIETARAVASLQTIVTATPRLRGLMLGAADLAADLGSATNWEALAYSRGALIAAAATATLVTIDSPFFDIHDEEGLCDETDHAVTLGFQAKGAIHPNQVAAINKALTPSDADVHQAREILKKNKGGVGVVDGQMIDQAVARKAYRTLAAAGVSPDTD